MESFFKSARENIRVIIRFNVDLERAVMAVRFSDEIFGVQFHPEYDGNIMKEYIFHQEERLNEMGLDVDNLIKNVDRCTLSNTILSNFIDIISM